MRFGKIFGKFFLSILCANPNRWGIFQKKNKKKLSAAHAAYAQCSSFGFEQIFWEKGLSVTSGRLAGSPYSPACVNRMLMSAI